MPLTYIVIILYVISIALAVAAYLLQPKPSSPGIKPGSLDNIPIAEQGKPIPVVFGRRYVKQPNVVWWGNVANEPIRKKMGGGGSS